MSDVKIEQEVVRTRAEVAQWIAELGKALEGEGTVSVRMADTTVELHVPDRIRCEVEVELDGDEVELELEFTWSTSRRGTRAGHAKAASGA